MNIILGASGQVGSAVVKNLIDKGEPVKGIVRNEHKASALKKDGAEYAIADASNLQSLKKAFKDGDTIFVLTPETGKEENVLAETGKILENYLRAIEDSPVQKIVGLSSIGAQHDKGTGNLLMSYMLEHAFTDLKVEKVFVRPAYYFSNWLAYADIAKETGVLPTFFPEDFSLPMISPQDVAEFLANVISGKQKNEGIYELTGAAEYSSEEVASAFSKKIGKKITAKQTPRNQWEEALSKIGFSKDGIKNFIEMTQAVIDGKAKPEQNGIAQIKTKTTLEKFLNRSLSA
jgi:uncharacterized protein YbjT (DUF2867 family)